MPRQAYICHEESGLLSVAKNILNTCNSVRIFALYGDLGAGKTTLVKDFCKALGVAEPVSSPTFSLINEYAFPGGWVYHFDFYRIKREEEAYDIGVDEYFDSDHYSFIEWPERIPSLLPPEAAEIHLTVLPDDSRRIELIY
ncbi:MAG: tRNA (adenosine(37)-N6)-threonylcarbamoyltransferase complex ATPase subunit type 1 TsaE [Bacteroidetes bacterium]|nr:MAG: tRNA (adenosine(37)-N6)-threonylcarbamoyltransferase complex ATPase subunit type 1 TsaE [Bacteroidota bacterium]